MKFETGKIYPKFTVSEYYSTYYIMIFPFIDYAESYEIKNVSALNVCENINA